jgi:hypothetical protein
MKRAAKIEIGQRFGSLGVGGKITGFYEVQALFRCNLDRLDYARIVDVGDRHHTKVLALGAMVDTRHFMPMPSRDYHPN